MSLLSRQVLLGMILGAVCATGVAAIGPGAVVEAFGDEAPTAIDTSKLVRFEGRDYDMQYEDWVDTDPQSHMRIKKVEYGRVSYVDVTTTATGTYSSDALFSDHIQYPGITVTDVTKPRASSFFSYWSGRGGWTSFGTRTGKSFLYLRTGSTRIYSGGNSTCVSGPGFWVC